MSSVASSFRPSLSYSRIWLLTFLAAALHLAAAPISARFAESGALEIEAPADGITNDSFGWSSVRGDFDGDGFDDLALGDWLRDVEGVSNSGAAFVAFGSPDGLIYQPEQLVQLSQLDADPLAACGQAQVDALFGQALAAGDFDDDGRDDLAVSLEGLDVGSWDDLGAVQIFFGQANRTLLAGPCFSYGQDGLPGVAAEDTAFGYALAVGDFDGDGRGDLAVGATGATVGGHEAAGAVTVIYAGVGGPLDPATAQLWHQDLADVGGEAEDFDYFGHSLATGDLIDGSDFACDLVIGSPNDHLESNNGHQGSIQLLFGCTESGLGTEFARRFSASYWIAGNTQEDQRFGESVAVGQFDCVGAHDVVVGAPEWLGDGGRGVLMMAYGDKSDPIAIVRDVVNMEDLGGPFADLRGLGYEQVAAPRDDGCDDLLVSAPGGGLSSVAGGVFALEARFGIGVTEAFHTKIQRPGGNGDKRLGRSLATGRFNGQTLSAALGVDGTPPISGETLDGLVWVLPEGIFHGDFEEGDLSAWSSVVGN